MVEVHLTLAGTTNLPSTDTSTAPVLGLELGTLRLRAATTFRGLRHLYVQLLRLKTVRGWPLEYLPYKSSHPTANLTVKHAPATKPS